MLSVIHPSIWQHLHSELSIWFTVNTCLALNLFLSVLKNNYFFHFICVHNIQFGYTICTGIVCIVLYCLRLEINTVLRHINRPYLTIYIKQLFMKVSGSFLIWGRIAYPCPLKLGRTMEVTCLPMKCEQKEEPLFRSSNSFSL